MDEVILFTDAMQLAATYDPQLLAKAGLAAGGDAVAQGAASELAAEDVALLKQALESGVQKKALANAEAAAAAVAPPPGS